MKVFRASKLQFSTTHEDGASVAVILLAKRKKTETVGPVPNEAAGETTLRNVERGASPQTSPLPGCLPETTSSSESWTRLGP